MQLGLEDKVVVITGAASGIGLATARLLSEEGAKLVLTDLEGVDWSDAERAAPEAVFVEADLTTQGGCREVVQTAAKKAGGCDVLVHTAGVTGAKGHPLEMSDEDWQQAYEIDFYSAVRLCREAVPAMRKAGWGRVVFVTSENAVQPYAEEAVYNCAKAALVCFTKNLSKVEAGHGIRVNAVAAAYIETPMTDGMMEKRAEERDVSVGKAIESFLEEERPGITAKRRGKPEEVAAVIALLASEKASFVDGSNWRVDCGSVMTADY